MKRILLLLFLTCMGASLTATDGKLTAAVGRLDDSNLRAVSSAIQSSGLMNTGGMRPATVFKKLGVLQEGLKSKGLTATVSNVQGVRQLQSAVATELRSRKGAGTGTPKKPHAASPVSGGSAASLMSPQVLSGAALSFDAVSPQGAAGGAGSHVVGGVETPSANVASFDFSLSPETPQRMVEAGRGLVNQAKREYIATGNREEFITQLGTAAGLVGADSVSGFIGENVNISNHEANAIADGLATALDRRLSQAHGVEIAPVPFELPAADDSLVAAPASALQLSVVDGGRTDADDNDGSDDDSRPLNVRAFRASLERTPEKALEFAPGITPKISSAEKPHFLGLGVPTADSIIASGAMPAMTHASSSSLADARSAAWDDALNEGGDASALLSPEANSSEKKASVSAVEEWNSQGYEEPYVVPSPEKAALSDENSIVANARKKAATSPKTAPRRSGSPSASIGIIAPEDLADEVQPSTVLVSPSKRSARDVARERLSKSFMANGLTDVSSSAPSSPLRGPKKLKTLYVVVGNNGLKVLNDTGEYSKYFARRLAAALASSDPVASLREPRDFGGKAIQFMVKTPKARQLLDQMAREHRSALAPATVQPAPEVAASSRDLTAAQQWQTIARGNLDKASMALADLESVDPARRGDDYGDRLSNAQDRVAATQDELAKATAKVWALAVPEGARVSDVLPFEPAEGFAQSEPVIHGLEAWGNAAEDSFNAGQSDIALQDPANDALAGSSVVPANDAQDRVASPNAVAGELPLVEPITANGGQEPAEKPLEKPVDLPNANAGAPAPAPEPTPTPAITNGGGEGPQSPQSAASGDKVKGKDYSNWELGGGAAGFAVAAALFKSVPAAGRTALLSRLTSRVRSDKRLSSKEKWELARLLGAAALTAGATVAVAHGAYTKANN